MSTDASRDADAPMEPDAAPHAAAGAGGAGAGDSATSPAPTSDPAAQLATRLWKDCCGGMAVALLYGAHTSGLMTALEEAGPTGSTTGKLAATTGLNARYIKEWLNGLAAARYISYSSDTGKYFLDDAQRRVHCGDTEALGCTQFMVGGICGVDKVVEKGLKAGGGVTYQEMHPMVRESIYNMHAKHHRTEMVPSIINKVAAIAPLLQKGALVYDVGCGMGTTSVAIAKFYPKSTVVGVDCDKISIERARKLAEGIPNLRFECGMVENLVSAGMARCDVAICSHCIHDLPNPVAGLRGIHACLRPTSEGVVGGKLLWLDPGGEPSTPGVDTSLPFVFKAVLSPLHCLTVAMACKEPGQSDDLCTGTMVGLERAQAIGIEAGFLSVTPDPEAHGNPGLALVCQA